MNRTLAPIILFAYNRPVHVKETVRALLRNTLASESDLIVYSDGPKSANAEPEVAQVRDFLKTVTGFKSVRVIEQAKNLGLSRSIIDGVTAVLSGHDRVIVLEDDIYVGPYFLSFMNEALSKYVAQKNIFSISGWGPPLSLAGEAAASVYLAKRALCWGWATWVDRWQNIDWDVKDFQEFSTKRDEVRAFAEGGDDLPDMLKNAVSGKINSWAIRWCFAQFRQNAFSVVPFQSFTENLGFDGSGENCLPEFAVQQRHIVGVESKISLPEKLVYDENLGRQFRRFYRYNWKARLKKIMGIL